MVAAPDGSAVAGGAISAGFPVIGALAGMPQGPRRQRCRSPPSLSLLQTTWECPIAYWRPFCWCADYVSPESLAQKAQRLPVRDNIGRIVRPMDHRVERHQLRSLVLWGRAEVEAEGNTLRT